MKRDRSALFAALAGVLLSALPAHVGASSSQPAQPAASSVQASASQDAKTYVCRRAQEGEAPPTKAAPSGTSNQETPSSTRGQ